MDYQKIYINLIDRANSRISEGYVEKHHIVPRCLGGTDAKENIVSLYPEEHYLAHLLLCKINKSNQKLLYAAMNMTTGSMINNSKRNNKAYGWLRRQYAQSMSGDNNPNRRNPEIQKKAALKRVGQKRTEETKARMSAAQKGRTFTEETKQKMSIAAKNKPPVSLETREKLSAKSKGRVGPWAGKTVPPELVAKRAEARRGKTDTEEVKLKKSLAAKAREAKKKELRNILGTDGFLQKI